MSGSDNQMHTPAFKWEWNINTALILSIAAGLLSVGYFVNDVVRINDDQGRAIGRLDMRVDRMSEEMRTLPNHELRITANERAITQGIGDMRSVTDTANELKSDVRVIREIVERIEGAQSRNGAARPARD